MTLTQPGSDAVPVFLALSGEIAGHLAIAISRYRQTMAVSGFAVPPELLTLGHGFASRALDRLGPTALEQLSRVSDAPPMPRQLLTYDETAEMLAVSTRTVERLINTGRLNAVRVTPNAPRVRVSDVADYVASLHAEGKVAS